MSKTLSKMFEVRVVVLAILLSVLLLGVASNVVNAANILIIEYGADKEVGQGCTINYECVSWLCKAGVCAECSVNTDCSETTSYCADKSCSFCSANADCDTFWCESGVCKKCSSDSQCPTKLCDESTGNCQHCTDYTQCASGYCDTASGSCLPCTTDSQCIKGVCSLGSCISCLIYGCPLSWKCSADNGKCYCKDNGEGCETGSECCSGTCSNSKCVSLIVSPSGETVTPGTVTGVGEVGAVGGELRVVRESERQVTSQALIRMLNLSKIKVEEQTTCIRNSRCNVSTDCCGADCVGGYCACSTRVCSSSGECCRGYCEEGLCVASPSMSLFLKESLQRPLKTEIGCAGLIDECLVGETDCFSLCSALTVLLLTTSVGAGAITWSRFDNPLGGILMTLLPIGIGFMFYPFVAIPAAILIILILMLGHKKE